MPLYKGSGANLLQMAQSAMGSATQAMAGQQKETTTVREEKTSFWDDLYKGARALDAGARAINGIAGAVDKGVGLYDKLRIRGAYDDIAKAFGEGGYEAIERNAGMQDYWHAQALGQFAKDRANSQKGMLEAMQKSEEMWDRKYQNWRGQAAMVNKAWESGDKGAFMNGMEDLVASSPIPYRLKQDGNGNFRELFRSDNDGGWVETGRTITPEQALEQMREILKGERMVLRGADMKLTPENKAFYEAAYRSMRATELGNAENRLNPKKHIPLYDRNGNWAGVGIIQNRIDDYNGNPQLYAYGKSGNHIGVFDGFEGLMKNGLAPSYASGDGKGRGRGRGLAGGGSYGGRSGRRGGSAGADEAEATVNGQKLYGVSSEDKKEFQVFAAYTDELGEKRIDSIKYDFCMRYKRKTGAPASTIMAAFDENTERVIAASGGKLDRRQAERIVIQEMWNRENREQQQESAGKGKGQEGSQVAGKNAGNMAASQEKVVDEKVEPAQKNGVHKRIRDAAEKNSKAKEAVDEAVQDVKGKYLNGVNKNQDRLYRGLQGLGESIRKNSEREHEEEDPWD